VLRILPQVRLYYKYGSAETVNVLFLPTFLSGLAPTRQSQLDDKLIPPSSKLLLWRSKLLGIVDLLASLRLEGNGLAIGLGPHENRCGRIDAAHWRTAVPKKLNFFGVVTDMIIFLVFGPVSIAMAKFFLCLVVIAAAIQRNVKLVTKDGNVDRRMSTAAVNFGRSSIIAVGSVTPSSRGVNGPTVWKPWRSSQDAPSGVASPKFQSSVSERTASKKGAVSNTPLPLEEATLLKEGGVFSAATMSSATARSFPFKAWIMCSWKPFSVYTNGTAQEPTFWACRGEWGRRHHHSHWYNPPFHWP